MIEVTELILKELTEKQRNIHYNWEDLLGRATDGYYEVKFYKDGNDYYAKQLDARGKEISSLHLNRREGDIIGPS